MLKTSAKRENQMKEAYTYSLIRRQPFILSRRNAYATVDNVSIERTPIT
ncbi:hypothetical protein ACNPFM_000461 [Vibrio parahaemolyticus]